jgi:hypothetical protein
MPHGDYLVGLLAAAGVEEAGAGDALRRLETRQSGLGSYLEALAAVRRGDARAAYVALDTYRTGDTTRVASAHRLALRALAGASRIAAGDSTAGLADMRTTFASGSIGALTSTPLSPVRFVFAATLATRPETRAEGIRLLRYGFTEGVVSEMATLPHALLALGHALEAEGDRAGATVAFERLLALWVEADPNLQATIGAVRERLASLRPDTDGTS